LQELAERTWESPFKQVTVGKVTVKVRCRGKLATNKAERRNRPGITATPNVTKRQLAACDT
jgi:hypothetical protein